MPTSPPPSPSVNPGPKVWRYAIPNNKYEGWAVLFIDEAGCFSILSDYGNWAYRWNARGLPDGVTFRQFFLECEDEYLQRKLAPEKVYDRDSTYATIREEIIRLRRRKELTAAEAASEWELPDDYEGLYDEWNAQQWCAATALSEPGEFICYKTDPQIVAFFEKSMPKLRELIRADLGL